MAINEQQETVSEVVSQLNKLKTTGLTYEKVGANKFSLKWNLDSFYGNVLEKSVEPIKTIFDSNELQTFNTILTTEIPLLSDFQEVRDFLNRDSDPNSISLRDLFEVVAESQDIEVNFGLLDEINNFQTFIDSIPDTGTTVELGAIEVDGAGNILNKLKDVNLQLESSLDLPSGFNIPLLQKPRETLYDIVSGNNSDIFTYQLPELKLDQVGYEASIPIIGPLGVTVGGNFTAKAQLGFGYDLSGFYINDNVVDGTDQPEFSLAASPVFGPALTIAGATLDVTAGISGGLDFNLKDDNGDQKIRLYEADLSKPSSLFDDPSIKVGFNLGGGLKVLGSTLWSFDALNFDFALGKIPPQVTDGINTLRPAIDTAIELAKLYYNPLYLLEKAGDLIIKGVNYLFEEAEEFVKWFDNAAGETVQQIQEVGSATIKEISQAGERIWDAAGNTFENLANGVNRVWDAAGNTFETLTNGVKRVWETTGNTFETLANGVERAWDQAGNTFEDVGNGVRYVWNKGGETYQYINDKIQQGWDKAGNILQDIGDEIEEWWDDNNPFKGISFKLSEEIADAGTNLLDASLANKNNGAPAKPGKPAQPDKPAKPDALNVNYIEISSDAPTSILNFGFNDTYYRQEIVDLNQIYAKDPNGYQDLARIDFFLQKPEGSIEKIGEAKEFTPWETDSKWGLTSFVLDLDGLPLGSYTLKAKAYDFKGQGGELYSQDFTIANRPPEKIDVAVDPRYEGRSFKPVWGNKETLVVNGIATDGDGYKNLDRVDFYLRNPLEPETGFYELQDATTFWELDKEYPDYAETNAYLSFHNVPVGNYELVAVTSDKDGGASEEWIEAITIKNSNFVEKGSKGIDTLTGSREADVFDIGSNYRENKQADYGLIVRFNPDEDTIQLEGESADYYLKGNVNKNLPKGTAIFSRSGNELVAVIEDVYSLDISGSYFQFV